MNKKNMSFAMILVIIGLVASVMASAMPTIEYTKINGDTAQTGDQLVVERGDKLDIRVRVHAGNTPEKNIQVEAYLDGYEYANREPVSDSETIFDMDANDTQTVDLSINIPLKAEKDYYDLKVRVGARTGASIEHQYRINLKGQRHELIIKEILMPDHVVAGRGLFANVKLQNIGQKDEKDVTVKFKIPEIGISEFTIVDEIEADDSTTTEDIVALIDECVKPGEYEVIAEASFNEFDKITKKSTIKITGSDICESNAVNPTGEKTVISVPQTQEVVSGSQAVFPIMLTNMGNKAKTYVITVSKGVETFGQARIDPSNVVIIQPNKPETVFVYIKTNENVQAGQKDFTVTVTSGDEKKEVPLNVNVVKGQDSTQSMQKALEIGLVVLIIILVIIGLIVGFNKLKPKQDDEEKEIGQQTYY